MTWAHYVAWMHPAETSMLAERYPDPAMFDVGEDPVRDEMRLARTMGLDGWFVDVVARKDRLPSNHSDFGPFLKAAEGTDFMVGPCLDVKTDVAWQVHELVRLLGAWGAHPNFPRVGGKYVVATYTWWPWTPDEWRAIREGCAKAGFPLYLIANLTFSFEAFDDRLLASYADVFDCGYTFGYIGRNGMTTAENHRRLAAFCAQHGKRWMPGLHPGYLGGWTWGRNAYYLPLEHLDQFHGAFLAAFGADGAHPQWSHVTSWNDHDETTVAPRLLTPGMRRLIPEYAAALKGLSPRGERPDVLFAYHREELPGTVIRLEAMRLPARTGADRAIEVRGALVDGRGAVAADLKPQTLTQAWDRVEWLVSSTALAKSPYLVPRFATDTGLAADFPALFFSEPWILNQQTVRETFADRVKVGGDFEVKVEEGVLASAVRFDAPVPLKRAVLYANDRPVGVFRPEGASGADDIQFSFIAWGEKKGPDFTVSVEGARETVKTRRQVRPREAHKVTGGKDMRFTFACGETKFSFTPPELLSAGSLGTARCGVEAEPDLGVYHSAPLNLSAGRLALRAFVRLPAPADAYWVRFETMDGRIAETAIRYPFAAEADAAPRIENVLETEITLEHPQGSAGRPGAVPFLDANALPVAGTRSVKAAVSPLATRTLDRKGPWSFAGDGQEKVRLLPHRAWPMDKGTIAFEMKPDSSCASNRTGVIFKDGVQSGFSFALDAGGSLLALWREKPAAKAVTVAGGARVRYGEWNAVRLRWDGLVARLEVNGKAGRTVPVPAKRIYGNCYVNLGGHANGERPFKGEIRNLHVTGDGGERKGECNR